VSVRGRRAIGLAAALARTSGQRALLLEADLRQPSVERYLGLPRTAGVSDYLASRTTSLPVRTLTPPGIAILAAGREKLAAREQRVGSTKGKLPKIPDPEHAQPAPPAQRNFTDPESRIMKDGATKEFVQGYNAQAAVDGHAQVIVACAVTQQAADVGQFVPMLEAVAGNVGQFPAIVTADAGYFSEANLTAPALAGIECYVPPDRQQHRGEPTPSPSRQNAVSQAMRAKLQTATGRAIYALRKMIVEPVFGQIKEARGMRRFWLRGVRNVRGEWTVICLTHNLLKLFRARACPAPA